MAAVGEKLAFQGVLTPALSPKTGRCSYATLQKQVSIRIPSSLMQDYVVNAFNTQGSWPSKLKLIFSKVFDLFWQELKLNYLYCYMESERERTRDFFFSPPELTFHSSQTKTSSLSHKHFSYGDWTDPVGWYVSCLMSLWGLVGKIPRVRAADV